MAGRGRRALPVRPGRILAGAAEPALVEDRAKQQDQKNQERRTTSQDEVDEGFYVQIDFPGEVGGYAQDLQRRCPYRPDPLCIDGERAEAEYPDSIDNDCGHIDGVEISLGEEAPSELQDGHHNDDQCPQSFRLAAFPEGKCDREDQKGEKRNSGYAHSDPPGSCRFLRGLLPDTGRRAVGRNVLLPRRKLGDVRVSADDIGTRFDQLPLEA